MHRGIQWVLTLHLSGYGHINQLAAATATTSSSSSSTTSVATTPEPCLSLPRPDPDDTRSPYDRFRARKKSLSVTDLVSNIWCEQQFEYTLLRGFKRKTPQMRRGIRVHKALEEQVQTSVSIELTSKEDAWGLKMFNVYQGLVALRQNGLTRELPVFGFLGDIFVQGIVDEVSFVSPHTREEGKWRTVVTAEEEDNDGEIVLGEDATTDVFGVPTVGKRIAYLSDTKTRASRSLPTNSQVRVTAIQLMLYHRLLSHLRTGTVDIGRALKLFQLDGGAKFTDSFIAEIAGLESGVSLETLLEHNSIWGMWELVRRQAQESMDSIGTEMGISYRSQADGSMIGFSSLMHDDEILDAHLVEVMKWWKGERSTVGVDIEDAWKCERVISHRRRCIGLTSLGGSCEFEATCEWRLAKLEEELQGRRAKRQRQSLQKCTAGGT